ncbi:hypothetical protein OVW21_26785, partial [Klebsiella pneumoniae]|uniref:hypothetical protein n=1 Tax=Klebsiella pneumoniae TaxID=573 RepID=UPI00226F09C2
HRRIDVDSTASMKRPPLAMTEIDLDDLEDLSDSRNAADTMRTPRQEDNRFSDDVFGDSAVTESGIDLDVGEPLSNGDREATQRQSVI